MSVAQWKCFWFSFLLVSILGYVVGTLLIYMEPKLYEGTSIFELEEPAVEGDLDGFQRSHEKNEPGATLRQLGNSSLYELKVLDQNPVEAAEQANNTLWEGLEDRLGERRSEKIKADQAAVDPESAEWRELEIRRISPYRTLRVRSRAYVSPSPTYPDVDRRIRSAFVFALGFGLVLAALITGLCRSRLSREPYLPWSIVGRRFAKFAPFIFGGLLVFSAINFQLQKPEQSEAVVLEFPKDAIGQFENDLEYLSSDAAIMEAIAGRVLARELLVELRPGVEVTGDPASATIEIRYTAEELNYVSDLPRLIAGRFLEQRQSDFLKDSEC